MGNKRKKVSGNVQETKQIAQPVIGPQLFPAGSFKWMAVLVFAFAFGIYFNTVFNDYALDDGIVITENDYTKKGFSGISEILSQETFSSVSGTKNELSGGRYRPLSLVTFAMEYGIFGARPSISHLGNAFLYAFLCVLLLYLLYMYVFPGALATALIAALIFAAHPLHADAVANIKGRDEVLCLLLLLASVIFYLSHAKNKSGLKLFASLACFFFSLLAKENGITFIAVVPLMLYFFLNRTIKQSVAGAVPFLVTFILYFLIRIRITGMESGDSVEVMNAPFLLAQGDEALATKIMVLGKDLCMLFYPHPLSFDYSYSQIPYVHFTDWKTIASLVANGLLVTIAIVLFRKRHTISFAILFYYVTLSIVTNIVFDVGSPFNERFLFQPSIGFSIAIAYLLHYLGTLKEENKMFRSVALLLGVVIIGAGALKTIQRNPEWKNNETLFTTDAKHAPNSAKTNNFAGVAMIHKGEAEKDSVKRFNYFGQAIPYLRKSLAIYPGFADAHINLGVTYVQQNNLDSSYACFIRARNIYPDNRVLNINLQYLSQQFMKKAVEEFAAKNTDAAIKEGLKSIDCNPNNVSALYNVGGYYLSINNVQKARELWTKALTIDPKNTTVKSWLDRINQAPPVMALPAKP